MKFKLAFLAAGLFASAVVSAQDDPVIMTIGGEPILKSEFEYIYNKNSSSSLDKKSLDEYVDLFVKFKMKVLEAKERQYDDQTSFKTEYASYKSQLLLPYLVDKESEDRLAHEAYERSKTVREVSHILIKTTGSDTATAFKRINYIYNELKGGANFAELAKNNSECPSSAKGGNLGLVKPFSMIYPFETAAYNTPVGTFSKPFRTEFGYHIVFVHSEMNVENSVRVSQIFKRSANPASKASADSILKAIRGGEDFLKMVFRSDDRDGVMRGGDLGWLVPGRFPAELELAARKLTKVGEVSGVVKTEFGYHILMLTALTPMKSYEEMAPELKARLLKDSRAMTVVERSRAKLEMRYAYTYIDGGLDPFYEVMKDTTLSYQAVASKLSNLDAPLFSISGDYYPQSMFVSDFRAKKDIYDSVKDAKKRKTSDAKKTLEKYKEYVDMTPKQLVDFAYDKYVNDVLTGLYKESLLEENSDLRNLLKEYADGLLLFDISNREVWSRASSSVGNLTNYFNEHKEKYKFASPRFRGVVIRCADKKTLDGVKQFVKKSDSEDLEFKVANKFNDKSANVKAVRGLYQKGDDKAVDQEIFGVKGAYSDTEYPFVVCVGELSDMPISYKEVKGPLTADYQNYLEEEWVKRLRQKYNVKINQEVLKTVKSNN